MPAVKLRKRVSPTNQFNKALQQVNGLYVHSSPPKGHYRLMADIDDISTLYVHTCPPRVLQMNPSVIRQWLRGGDVDQLEQVVLEGQGHKLIGEYSPDPKVRNFLKIVPNYMTKIGEVNEAVNKGDLKRLKNLIPPENSDSMMKNIAMCKDFLGVGLLHKAVYMDHPNIVEWLVTNYPQTTTLKDRDGKTALHYCGVCGDPEAVWRTLITAGADPNVVDTRGRTAAHYMERPGDIELPELKLPSGSLKRFTSGKDGLVVKPSNIRIWIHDRDLGRLQQVLWEGHGGKLRTETSNQPKVKKFLDGVPYIMNAIKDVHIAVINNDYDQFVKKTSEPVPIEILGSKDANGLNPLHKAVGIGHRKIVEDILERNSKLIFSTDHDGRTPLHYAAGVKDGGKLYNFLMDNGADEMAFDNTGKMASFYKTNPKELPSKLLEVVPDAPRMSVTFPPTWDWGLLQPVASGTINVSGLSNQFGRTIERNKKNFEEFNPNRLRPPDDMFDATPKPPTPPKKPEPPPAKVENSVNNHVQESNLNHVSNHNQNVDIWRNEEDEEEGEEDGKPEEAAHNRSVEEDDKSTKHNSSFEDEKRNRSFEEESNKEEENSRRQRSLDEEENATRQKSFDENERSVEKDEPEESQKRNRSFDEDKNSTEEEVSPKKRDTRTEREIAEERQRLLDEGLLTLTDDDEEEVSEGDKDVYEIIKSGDMEKLASMVLNGEGDKLLGKKSKNPEIQSFLDNVPIYMTKIKTVHKAARDGELRELQAALDRRRFAVAKDSTNTMGVTPLHVATLFGRTPVVKYLGGRFPETLNAKDKHGRTPLHYAAAIADNGHYFNVLLNLGADRKVKDNSGHVPGHYVENPGVLTQEMLLKEYNAPAQIARDMLSDKVPQDHVSSRRHLQDTEVIAMLDQCMDIIQTAREKGSKMPLVKFLTRNVFNQVKLRITKNDRNLLDVIWPGIRILQETGIGKLEDDEDYDDFDLSGGIIASDFETYVVFEDLIMPMIKDMHGLGGKIPLNPHPNPSFFKKDDLSSHVDLVNRTDPDLDNGGILAPDFESYQVYEEVIMPIVKDIHGIDKSEKLKSHPESEFFKNEDVPRKEATPSKKKSWRSRLPMRKKVQESEDKASKSGDETDVEDNKDDKDDKDVEVGKRGFFRGARDRVSKMMKRPENAGEAEGEKEKTKILQNLRNRVNKIINASDEEEPDLEATEEKKTGIFKGLRNKVNQMVNNEVEDKAKIDKEGLVDDIKSKVRKLVSKARGSDSDTETESDVVTRETKEDVKPEAEDVVDRSKTAVIRPRPPTRHAGTGTGQMYKMTRTQKLREELRQKQEEDSRKQKEEEEKERNRYMKRGKEVNILVLDREEDKTPENVEEIPKESEVEEETETEKPKFLNGIKEKVNKLMRRSEEVEETQKNEIQIETSGNLEEADDGMRLDVTELDPTSKYVISAKIECSRNLDRYQLPASLREEELDIIERKLKSALKYQSIIGAEGVRTNGRTLVGFGTRNHEEEERYCSVQDLLTRPSSIRAKLAANELLIPLAENTGSFHCNMLHGTSWPSHRGVYLSKNGNLAAWINVQEHLRIISCTAIENPGGIGEAYGRLAVLVTSLDKHLKPKRSASLGFLTSRPCCLGNTLRFQVLIRLPRLAKEQPGSVAEICKARGLILSKTKESDSVFKIRNRQCLGVTEHDTYNNFTTAIVDIIELEKSLAQEKSKHVSSILKNIFTKRNFQQDKERVTIK